MAWRQSADKLQTAGVGLLAEQIPIRHVKLVDVVDDVLRVWHYPFVRSARLCRCEFLCTPPILSNAFNATVY